MTVLKPEWQSWYAWYPVRIKGKWYFRKTVYRYWRLTGGSKGGWEYGDSFDLLTS